MALACAPAERNKCFILEVIQQQLRLRPANDSLRILEIASGTGEHCACFAEALNNVIYQPTEPDPKMTESIVAWSSGIQNSIVNAPIAFDVSELDVSSKLPACFCQNQTDVVICINMIHISPFSCTDDLFRVAAQCIRPDGFVITYGPYKVNGTMVDSNIAFDESLKSRNPQWGVRNLEDVEMVASKYEFMISDRVSMPANNLCVIFRKRTT